MSMRRGGFTDEDDRLAKLLMAEFERVEHRPVTASWVATFADMARAVRLDREQSPAVPGPLVTESGPQAADETLAERDARLNAWLAQVSVGDIVTVRLNSTDTLTGKVYEAPDASGRTALYVYETLLRYGNRYPGHFEPMPAAVPAPVGEGLPLTRVLAKHQYLPGVASCSCNQEGYLGAIRSTEAHAEHLATAITAGFEIYIRKLAALDRSGGGR